MPIPAIPVPKATSSNIPLLRLLFKSNPKASIIPIDTAVIKAALAA